MELEISDDNFKEEVLQSGGVFMLDCFAEWCAPCKALTPLLSELTEENLIKLGLVNVDDSPGLAVKLRVTAVPKVVFFKDGKEKDSLLGIHPKSTYQEIIEKLKG